VRDNDNESASQYEAIRRVCNRPGAKSISAGPTSIDGRLGLSSI
jgi:hypothetical protein